MALGELFILTLLISLRHYDPQAAGVITFS